MSKVIWLAYLGLLVLGWLDNIRSPFFPDILKDLNLSATAGASIFATVSLVSFLVSLTAAFWLNRYGALRILKFALFGLGVTFILFSQAPNFPLLVAGSALFGVSYGFINFSQNIVIQENASVALRRRLYAGLHSMYGIASLLAPTSATFFIEHGFDWRASFLTLGCLPILLSLWARNLQSQAHRMTDVIASSMRLSKRGLWAAGLCLAFYMFGEISVGTRLVQLLRGQYDFSPEQANNYLALFSLLLLLGRILFTMKDLKVSNRQVLIYSAMSTVLALVLGLVHDPAWFVVSGATMSPFYPVAINYLAELFGPNASKAISFGVGLGSLAQVILHFSLGILTDAYGLKQALWLSPVGVFIVVLLLYFQPPPYRPHTARRET